MRRRGQGTGEGGELREREGRRREGKDRRGGKGRGRGRKGAQFEKNDARHQMAG